MQLWAENQDLANRERATLALAADPERFDGMQMVSVIWALRSQAAQDISPSANRTFSREIPELVIPFKERLMVLGDPHFPLHHEEMFKRALRAVTEHQITSVVWPGDVLDNGYKGHRFMRDCRAATRAEGVAALQEALLAFDAAGIEEHFMCPGNHDDKPLRGTDQELLFSDWIRAALGDFSPRASLTFSDRYYIVMEARGGSQSGPDQYPWRFTHQKNYSKIPLSTAREIAAIKLSNVVCAHQHHCAMGWASNGLMRAIDGGCLQDPAQASYKEIRDSRHPEWNPGFVILLDGKPRLED